MVAVVEKFGAITTLEEECFSLGDVGQCSSELPDFGRCDYWRQSLEFCERPVDV